MKILSTCLAIVFGLFFNPDSEIFNSSQTSNAYLLNNQILCSTRSVEATCIGSIYCNACKNCKYCNYCNSGGSCGVCGKRSKNDYSILKKKKTKPKRNFRKKYPSDQNKMKPFSNHQGKIYIVTQKTSLRKEGHSKAPVLQRLRVNDEVLVIDSSEEYWWVVRCNGDIGWVKKHLLRAKDLFP